MRNNNDRNQAAFLSIRQMAEVSGLSMYALRKGIHEGTIPHISSGTKILIPRETFLQMLRSEAEAAIK